MRSPIYEKPRECEAWDSAKTPKKHLRQSYLIIVVHLVIDVNTFYATFLTLDTRLRILNAFFRVWYNM